MVAAPSRAVLPELASGAYEVLCSMHPPGSAAAEEEEEEAAAGGGGISGAGAPAAPTYLALVDVASGAEFLDLVRTALAAALEALPPAARVGLLTFGGEVRREGYGWCWGSECVVGERGARVGGWVGGSQALGLQ